MRLVFLREGKYTLILLVNWDTKERAEQRSATGNHFESVGTLDNKVFGTTGNLGVTVLLITCNKSPASSIWFLMGKIRVLKELVHGIVSPCLIKSSTSW